MAKEVGSKSDQSQSAETDKPKRSRKTQTAEAASATSKPAAAPRTRKPKGATAEPQPSAAEPAPKAPARKASSRSSKAPAGEANMPAFENTAPAADKAATAEKAPAKPRTRSAKASASATETATNSKTAETIPAVEKPEAAPDAIDANAAAPTASAKPPASTPKPWLASYPPNVPADIVGLPADSLGAMIVAGCKTHGAKPAFTSMGKSLSFTDFAAESEAMAAYFQSLGLKKGARIALMMPNILQYPIALAGALRAGYVVVNVNPLYTARELEHQLNDSGAEAIVILENFANVLQRVVNNTAVRHVIVAAMGDLLGLKGFAVNLVVRRVKKMVPAWQLKNHVRFNAALKAGRGMTFKPVTVTADDLAFLQYTGGTTGVAKGAMLTHGNVLANVAQNAAWLESAFVKHKRPEQAVYLCALPLYHIYALTVNALTGIHLGSQNVLVANPRDIPALVKDFKQHKVNFFPGLNTLFNALLNNEDFKKLDFSALVLTFGGGMAVQQAVADRWQKLTGGVISEGYGLSETSPVATANPFDAEKFSGTIGLPLPSTEISIRNDNNEEVATGEAGEICIRGPQVMKGYWNRPDETAKVMTADGFLKSGDIGFMDEKGYTKIVDRKKDMILVSGFNVYPNEIEDVVARHPKVLEVAAVGVPDEKSGEVPKLFVVKKDASLTEDEVRSFCRENLTGYKRPRLIEFRDELPKTNVGKILRRELRG